MNSVFGHLVFVDEEKRIIEFSKEDPLDLKSLLQAVSSKYENKHFKELKIDNEFLESIQDDILGEITVEVINIEGCKNLKKIHKNAFGKSTDKIKKFDAMAFDSRAPNLKTEPNTDYDLDQLFNSLVNCEEIHIKPYKSEVGGIMLRNLKTLCITHHFATETITSIQDYAFYHLESIESIGLTACSFKFISENAFHFKNASDQLLEINLWDCQLTEECFAPNSLTNFRRPVKFDWQFNDSAYLKEEIFKPFLDADQRNEVVVTEDYFEPDDERNQWNQNDENYKNRVILECRP